MCRFDDTPQVERGVDLARMHLWSEAADMFAAADRDAPLDSSHSWYRIACLVARRSREPESRRVFAEVAGRSPHVPAEVVLACPLPPERSADRDQWIGAGGGASAWGRREANRAGPTIAWRRSPTTAQGRYAEAKSEILLAGPEQDFYMRPLLAAILHRLGKTEEARKSLQETERQHTELIPPRDTGGDAVPAGRQLGGGAVVSAHGTRGAAADPWQGLRPDR